MIIIEEAKATNPMIVMTPVSPLANTCFKIPKSSLRVFQAELMRASIALSQLKEMTKLLPHKEEIFTIESLDPFLTLSP